MKAKYLDRQFPAEYGVWRNMLQRCKNPNNPKYLRYGGRGIKVCEQWKRFDNFIADMGLRPMKGYSIERRENNGDYEPSNCYWATRDEQENNKEKSIKLTYNGKTLSLAQWARKLGMSYDQIRARHRYGWTVKDILNNPKNKYRKTRAHNERSNLITYKGVTQSVTEWAEEKGLTYDVLRSRIRYGWGIERALMTPSTKRKR